MPMPQQLPQIAVLPTRYPDLGETIFQQQAQNQLRILTICFLLAYSFGPDLGCVSDPQLKLQLGHQALEPACVAARFHSHAHLLPRQSTVELLRLLGMPQPSFLELSGVGIYQSNLLELGMEIYSYNDHRSAPFSRAGWLVLAPPTLLGPRSRHCHGINYTHDPPGGMTFCAHSEAAFEPGAHLGAWPRAGSGASHIPAIRIGNSLSLEIRASLRTG